MKTRNLLTIIAGTFILGLGTACSHHSHPAKPLPPGQAKKVTGSKSAKPYAPGQQKKH